MPLDRHWIETHIPHQAKMCLLDEVLSSSEAGTRCRAISHRASDNPLRAFGRLGAAAAIEYAAQTMAVHGAIVAEALGSRAPRGFLASLRNVRMSVERLDDLTEDLITEVRRLAGDASTAMYEFVVLANEREVVSGRATIAFLPAEMTGRGP